MGWELSTEIFLKLQCKFHLVADPFEKVDAFPDSEFINIFFLAVKNWFSSFLQFSYKFFFINLSIFYFCFNSIELFRENNFKFILCFFLYSLFFRGWLKLRIEIFFFFFTQLNKFLISQLMEHLRWHFNTQVRSATSAFNHQFNLKKIWYFFLFYISMSSIIMLLSFTASFTMRKTF